MLGHHAFLAALGSRVVLGSVLGTREVAPTGQFGLYAYGSNIGGAQIFYSNEGAFVGDQTQMDDEEAALVLFTTGPNNALVGNPDTLSSRAFPSWSDKAFFVPTSTSPSHRVGFRSRESEPDTDTDTSGFVFYGATALHLSADNTLHGLWYAVPTFSSKIWALRWNATGDTSADDRVSVTLRNTPPAMPFDTAL
ncbi:putative cytochrome p450 protein [Rosellinia necatrix]|uniref:Putative cytochrome p450 protein n=1 Tax=Rosellinia necatrix TaxID=77044 RepID=A0A1W2TFW4_ROSNE|nr:putative cytochrome p450 protein [Rosellinia necatrix]